MPAVLAFGSRSSVFKERRHTQLSLEVRHNFELELLPSRPPTGLPVAGLFTLAGFSRVPQIGFRANCSELQR